MKTLSPAKQLEILNETVERLDNAPSDDSRIEAIFDALQALGFDGNIRCRVAQVNELQKVLALRYARGEYGHLPISDIRYDVSSSLSGKAVTEGVPLYVEDMTPPSSRFAHPALVQLTQVQSMAMLPLKKSGRVIGVLTIDSTERNAFDPTTTQRMLKPYQHLLGSVLTTEVQDHPRDDFVSFLEVCRRNMVLVLGKDTGTELDRLISIAQCLREQGYDPILVKDYRDIPEMSNEEKVRTFAGFCRFVVLENSFPAGQIVECKICATNRIVTAALREEGRGSSFMVTDYFKDFDFMKEFTFDSSPSSIQVAIREAVAWAEALVDERIKYYNSLYPWRNPKALEANEKKA